MYKISPEKHFGWVLSILTIFAIIGPISIDLCTPSLPAMAEHFGVSSQLMQWCIGIYMIGFAVSMLICGSLADHFGRKKLLTIGYSCFIIATSIIITTDNIYILLAARFFQATLGCFGTAVARTIACDYYNDSSELRMFAYISACMMLAPLLAPIIGGVVQEFYGWQWNFVIMLTVSIIALFLLKALPERYEPPKGEKLVLFSKQYLTILRNKHYLRYTIASGSSFAAAFAFIVGAPFIFIEEKGISPTSFGVIFAVVVSGYIFSSAILPRVNKYWSRLHCIRGSIVIMVVGVVISLVFALLTHGQSVWGYVLGVVVYEIGLGVYIPTCQVMATEQLKTSIGVATSLIFFIEMVLVAITLFFSSWVSAPGTIELVIMPPIMLAISLLCRTHKRINA